MGNLVGKLFLGHEPNVSSMTEKILESQKFKDHIQAQIAISTPAPQKVSWDVVFNNSCTEAADGSCTFNWKDQWVIHRDVDGNVTIKDVRTGRMQVGNFGLFASDDGKLHIYHGSNTDGRVGVLNPDGSYMIE